jgi:uncharacterized protein
MLMPGIQVCPSPGRGRGLFAIVPIRRGQVVWHPCTDCEIFAPGAIPSPRRDEVEELGYYLRGGSQILPCRDACLVNHSCEAPVLDFGLDFGLAVRDVAPDEEITIDYRTFRHDPAWVVQCNCRSARCATEISPRAEIDPELAKTWLDRLRPALAELPSVFQPLHHSLLRSSEVYRLLATRGSRVEGALPTASICEPVFLSQLHQTTTR